MTAVPIAFQTNRGKYAFMGVTSLVNAYAEKLGEDAKGMLGVMACDGTLPFASGPDTPCRGAIYCDDLQCAYLVHSSSAWKLTSDGAMTRIGTIPGASKVTITRNQATIPQIVVQTDVGCYVIASDSVTRIVDPDLPYDTNSVDYLVGYVLYFGSTGRWYYSEQSEATIIDGLSFYTAEQLPDRLVRGFVDRSELFLFGTKVTEVWAPTGDAEDPFRPRSGSSTIPKGLLAKHSVVSTDGSILFVGSDGIVYRLNGYTPTRISNHEVERAIEADPNPEAIEAMAWASQGHSFYNITGSNWSYSYDAATGVWHRRRSHQKTRWRHSNAFQAWGKTIVTDRFGGNVYYFDSDTTTEAGAPMIWDVVSPTMHAFPNGGIVDAMHFDMATGYGRLLPTDQGYDPVVMLSWSNDGGSTFPITRHVSLGKRGQYRTRVTSRRLGRFGPQGRVWKLSVSDPVARGLVAADAAVRPLKL
ncbi:MAG TPA: hypothetical protein VNQ99_12285 [Xanthobacteraceae bacterium]|nr:hypothetical protein [Xanthobacteraceae bacterium]